MNKIGNRGQSLAIFVIFIPVFIMIGTLVVDVAFAKYNARKLDNITMEVIRYGLKHFDEEPYNNMVDLIYQNDSDIDSYKIDFNEEKNTINVNISKATKGFFGSIVGKDIYSLKSSYMGYLEDDKIIIEKKATKWKKKQLK